MPLCFMGLLPMAEAKDTEVQVEAGTKFLLDIPYRYSILPLTVTCTTATLQMCGVAAGRGR